LGGAIIDNLAALFEEESGMQAQQTKTRKKAAIGTR
jgi:hypothetical protein